MVWASILSFLAWSVSIDSIYLAEFAYNLDFFVLLSSVVKTRPLTIFCRSVCGYMFVLLSFTFIPEYFPYDATEYSSLYIKQQVGIYFFVPIIIGIAVCMLPINFVKSWITIAFVLFILLSLALFVISLLCSFYLKYHLCIWRRCSFLSDHL